MTQDQDMQSPALLDLRANLRHLHSQAGAPSLRTMADSIGDISHSTIQAALRGKALPKWAVLEKIVEFLDGDVADFRSQWVAARDIENRFDTARFDPGRRRVFLAWSGKESRDWSGLEGLALLVIQNVEIHSSFEDVRPGTRWADQGQIIQDSDLGILCLTSNSVESPWLLFEAGLLPAKHLASFLYCLIFRPSS